MLRASCPLSKPAIRELLSLKSDPVRGPQRPTLKGQHHLEGTTPAPRNNNSPLLLRAGAHAWKECQPVF
jgi:hypothetical protein